MHFFVDLHRKLHGSLSIPERQPGKGASTAPDLSRSKGNVSEQAEQPQRISSLFDAHVVSIAPKISESVRKKMTDSDRFEVDSLLQLRLHFLAYNESLQAQESSKEIRNILAKYDAK